MGKPRSRWRSLLWIVPLVVVLCALLVLLARWLREMPSVADFVQTYPGRSSLPTWAPVGFPAWLAWQHALNAFFMILIIRTGWQVRTQRRPPAYWTRNNRGLIRTSGEPKKISLTLWSHLTLDALWILNGVLFYVLIFSTGQWTRIVPTSWDVIPNALSAVLQYASLNWPVENGWINYNGLQLLSYFAVVFLVAPISIVTGLRMSAVWPASGRASTIFPIEAARKVHFPTMVFFVAFIVVHVTLVLSTGALNNLDHMYAVRNDESWLGFSLFVVSLVAIAVGWIGARPLFLSPVAARFGKISTR